MNSLTPQNDRRDIHGHLSWVAGVEDYSGMRIYEITAPQTYEQCPGDQGLLVRKRVSAVKLLGESLMAPRAAELPVESIKSLCLSGEDIFMSFDELPSELGVQGLVSGHGLTITQPQDKV